MNKISFKYKPTSLFSLKDSNSTNSGAKSVFLPSPYSIKMAMIDVAIKFLNLYDELSHSNSKEFRWIRDICVEYYLPESSFIVINNCFVRILKKGRDNNDLQQTISFREYLYMSSFIEIIFNIEKIPDEEINDSKILFGKIMEKINYFGKRGSFFQFIESNDSPRTPNVIKYENNTGNYGILQSFDDFNENANFDMINNYSDTNPNRNKIIYSIPMKNISSSKDFILFGNI